MNQPVRLPTGSPMVSNRARTPTGYCPFEADALFCFAMSRQTYSASFLAAIGLLAAAASAEVTRIEITSRGDLAHGAGFGSAGAYEKFAGTLHFAISPDIEVNKRVSDIQLERYESREHYLRLATEHTTGYLLAEDLSEIVRGATGHWDMLVPANQ